MSEFNDKIETILKNPQICHLATISDNGKPWTRPMFARRQENGSIVMATSRSSRKVADIKANPEVHLALGGNQSIQSLYQIQALAKVVDDSKSLNEHWNPMLKKYFSGPEDPEYVLIVAEPYLLEQLDMGQIKANVLKP